MAGSIGGYRVNILPGSRMRGPRRVVVRREAPEGVNGVEVERGAYTIPASVYVTEATVANKQAALALVYAYEQLIGEDVTVTDEDGTTYENVTVIDAISDDPEKFALILGADTAGDVFNVRMTWSLQLPYTPIKMGGLSQ